MSRDQVEKYSGQIRTMARICNPANNASEGERANAARMIETLLPRLVDAASRKVSLQPPAPPPSPLDDAEDAWEGRFGAPLTSDQRASLIRILYKMAFDAVIEAMGVAHRRHLRGNVKDPFAYFAGICWRQIRGPA